MYDWLSSPNVASQYALAEITVARERDVGQNDIQYVTRTHLGNLLQIGDLVLGFAWTRNSINWSFK